MELPEPLPVVLNKIPLSYRLLQSVLFLIKDKFQKDLNYLEDSIEIEFPKSIDCEWENGEVIYYIPNSYTENKFLLF